MKNSSLFGLFISLFLMGSASLQAAAATNPLKVYLPAGNKVVPAPPAEGTPIWQRDTSRYWQERTLVRHPKRTVTKQDSILLKRLGVTKNVGALDRVDSLIAANRQPYESWLKTYGYDANSSFILDNVANFPALQNFRALCVSMKDYNTDESLYRERNRPYCEYGDWYFGKSYKGKTSLSSYPSGHGYFAGLFGMSLSYADPKFSKEVVINSNAFGYQRLILSAHWESDVTQGSILGNVAFALALHDSTFVQRLRAATAELSAKEGHSISFDDARSHFQYLPNGKDVSDAPLATSTFAWKADSMLYMQAIDIRETPRGAQALLDADYSTWLKRFSADSLMGVDLTNKQLFPNLHEMVAVCHDMAVYAADASRNHLRVAPNTYFAKGQTQTSAISEKAYMAWALGLALAYINPDTVGAKIARTALAMADANYILGDCWQSEVENSEKLGAIGFAMAMRNPYFRALADAAIQELAYAKTVVVVPEDSTQTLEQAQAAVNTVLDACMNKTKDIMITRTFYCDGYYNTLCLPFSISATDWADTDKNPLAAGTLKKFVDVKVEGDVLYIQLEDADSIQAGKPYLIKFAAGDKIVNPVFKSMKVTTKVADASESESMNCQGVMAPCTIDAQQAAKCLIMGEKNTLYWADINDGEYLRSFRAYFKVSEAPAAPIRRGMAAKFADEQTTTALPAASELKNIRTYKIIDNGQVVIVRDGIVYSVGGVMK